MSSTARWIGLMAVLVVAGAGVQWWMASRAEPQAAAEAASEPGARRKAAAPEDAGAALPKFEDGAHPPEPLPATDPGSADAPAPDATDAADGGAGPVVDAGRLETLARLGGRVTRSDTGAPVAGLKVEADFSQPALVAEFTSDVTDEQGRFRFALSAATRITALRVRAGADTRGLSQALDLELKPGQEHVRDLAVTRGARVSGSVVSEGGQPVAGARVRAWNDSATAVDSRDTAPDQEVVTDAAGAFALGGLGPTCVIAADASGLTGLERLSGTVASGARLQGLVLTLGPEHALSGQVINSSESPIAGAYVSLEPDAPQDRQPLSGVPGIFRILPAYAGARSADDGGFVVAGLAELGYRVSVKSERYTPWTGKHAPGDPELLVKLSGGTTLRGTVLSEQGDPIANAEVTVATLPDGPWPRRLRTMATDADGRFEFIGLSADEHGALLARAEGHALQIEQPVVITEAGPNEVSLVLEAEHPLGGVVVDQAGQPVAGRAITIEGDRSLPLAEGLTVTPKPTWEKQFAADETRTDAQGRFRLGSLYDGLFELRVADAAEQGTEAKLEVRSGQQDLRIVLGGPPAGVTLLGSVRDALTGLPLQSFRLTPMVPGGSGGMSGDDRTFENQDGAFRIAGLEPGEIEPWLQAPGYSDLHVPIRDYPEGEHRLDLQMYAERVLELRVVDDEREPVKGVTLSFLDASGEAMWVKSGVNTGTTQLKTDASGEAIAMGLPASRVTVRAKSGFFSSGQDFRFDLRAELHGTQVLVLGDDGEATVLVMFFGAKDPSAFDPVAKGLEETMAALQKQIEAGNAWPIETPLTIRALSAGKSVAEQRVDPAAPPGSSTEIPGVPGVCNVAVEVPAEPLELEIAAEGYASVRRAWQPDRASDEAQVVLVVLRRS